MQSVYHMMMSGKDFLKIRFWAGGERCVCVYIYANSQRSTRERNAANLVQILGRLEVGWEKVTCDASVNVHMLPVLHARW